MTAEVKRTNAERLDALLLQYAPRAVAFHTKYGTWPAAGDEDEEMLSPSEAIQLHTDRLVKNDGLSEEEADKLAVAAFASKATAPYVIKTVKDGLRVLITKDDGTVIAGSGATMDEALSKLEGEGR